MAITLKRRAALIAIIMIISLTLAACGGSAVDGEQVVRRMETTLLTVNTTHSVVQVHIDLSSPQVSGDITAEFWQQTSPALFHGEIHTVNINGLDSLMQIGGAVNNSAATPSANVTPEGQPIISPATVAGSVLIADGANIWLYTPASNHVYKAALNTKDISMAQVQVFIQGIQGVVDRILAVSDVKGIGEEQVNGRDAYKVELTARQDLTQGQTNTTALLLMGGKVTLWVDKQLNIPLKLQYDNASMGSISVTAVNPEVNPTIPAARFTFTPPAGVKVTNVGNAQPLTTTLPRANTTAGYTLLVPPDLANLSSVSQLDIPNPEAVTAIERITFLDFENNNPPFDISEAKSDSFTAKYAQQQANPNQATATSQSVTVRGVIGTAVITSANNETRAIVYWTDKSGTIVYISGSLSLSDTLKLAESLQPYKP